MSANEKLTPWVARSPANDSQALDVYNANGTKLHHGYWGGKDVAHLIAAAPELLEALLAIEEHDNLTEDGCINGYCRHLLRTALAKARGGK